MKKNIKNLKLLFLYRSFLFKYIKSETQNKDYKKKVKALNIKKIISQIIG